jgi:hypothetical protein
VDDEEVRAVVAALESRLERLEPEASETIGMLLQVYGEGLRRIVEVLRASPEQLDELARDELVSHLLLLHDLYPHAAAQLVSPAIAFGPVLIP